VPSFNESISINYLDNDADERYIINTHEFLPAVAVCDSFQEAVVEQKVDNCNNLENWDVWFEQQDLNQEVKIIEAVSCQKLIASWTDLVERER